MRLVRRGCSFVADLHPGGSGEAANERMRRCRLVGLLRLPQGRTPPSPQTDMKEIFWVGKSYFLVGKSSGILGLGHLV